MYQLQTLEDSTIHDSKREWWTEEMVHRCQLDMKGGALVEVIYCMEQHLS
jgi:hypothetical protein